MAHAVARLMAAGALVCAAAGAQPDPRVAVLLPESGVPGLPAATAERLAANLRDDGIEAEVVSAAQTDGLSPERYPVVLADLRVCSVATVGMLQRHLAAGGRLVSLTAPAFGSILINEGGQWLDEEGRSARRASLPAESLFWPAPDPASLAEWGHASGSGQAERSLAAIEGPEGNPGFEVLFANTQKWDAVIAPVPAGASSPAHNLLSFHARGDAATPEISIELTERDGSRWVAVVRLSEEWRHYTLAPRQFRYWPDNPSVGRGGADDQVRLVEVVAAQFGVSENHTPSKVAGPHVFAIAGFGSAADPYASAEVPKPPVLEALSPDYKVAPVGMPVRLTAAPDQSLIVGAWSGPVVSGVSAPPARPQGRGYARGAKWRLVPVLVGRDAHGATQGAAAWILLPHNQRQDDSSASRLAEGAAWACFGFGDLAPYADPRVRRALRTVVRSLSTGEFLLEGGAAHFLYRPGEAVRLGAVVRRFGAGGGDARVRAGIEEAESARTVWQSDVEGALAGSAAWVAPPLAPGGYDVVVELLRGGSVVDRIAHPLTVTETPGPPASEDLVRVRGEGFELGGKPWFAVGANYWSAMMSGLEPEDYWGSWLVSRLYDPVSIEADLAQMERWGLTVVAAICADLRWSEDPVEFERECRNLEDFLRRCHDHHLKAYVFLGPANPIGPNPDLVDRIIRGAHLDRSPAILAYDIIWEPFYYRDRVHLDAEWEAWVINRYGSVSAAEADWGFPANRREDGRLTAPDDLQCQTDGPWRAMVAAYRRAFSDILGKRYARAVRMVKSLDPHHMVTFRAGAVGWPAGFPHLESVALRKYIDFICPESYGLEATYGELTPPERIRRGGLVTRYYTASTGKPVVWMEFAAPLYPNGTPWRPGMNHIPHERLAFQVAEYESFLGMFLESGAAGCMAWWYPGGFRVNEGSDCGLSDPLNRPRPVAHTLSTGVDRFYGRGSAAPNRWIEVDGDATALGLWGELAGAYGEYTQLMEQGYSVGVRIAGQGSDSVTAPPLAVGNLPMTGTNPPRFLNALFTPLEVRGADGEWREVADGEAIAGVVGEPLRFRASVGNVGEAAWVPPYETQGRPGGVVLRVKHTTGKVQEVPIEARVPSFGDVVILFEVEGSGQVEIQMVAEGRSPFGERVALTIAEP